jgi:hypothetical protein
MLQKAAFAKFPDLREFSLANVASVDTKEALLKHFGPLRYGCGTVSYLQFCCIWIEIICCVFMEQNLVALLQPGEVTRYCIIPELGSST